MKKVKVDRDLCIGCGTCTGVAPKTFELDNEGKSVILRKDGTKSSDLTDFSQIDDTEENIINAEKSCPVAAIIVTEEAPQNP
ncbi:MAG: ferredoxin [Patescibacteria group bacterium]|nr:ferredoxin [Patescibacteria group bacterium]